MNIPFDLINDEDWRYWRDEKLKRYPKSLNEISIEVADLVNPTPAEKEAINRCCDNCNMALFSVPQPAEVDKASLVKFGVQFGLIGLNHNEGADEDGVSAISVVESEWRRVYVPYTDRPISWHTDGYYNTAEKQIQGLLLYCDTPAISGGENALLDHEIMYLLLREKNPDLVEALMQPEAMMIPANQVKDHIIRPDSYGCVFSVRNNQLHMRYTARKRNVVWEDNELIRAATAAMTEILQSDTPLILRGTLERGQGLICNNVLHDRSGFTDDQNQRRLLYRLRYYERISHPQSYW